MEPRLSKVWFLFDDFYVNSSLSLFNVRLSRAVKLIAWKDTSRLGRAGIMCAAEWPEVRLLTRSPQHSDVSPRRSHRVLFSPSARRNCHRTKVHGVAG